MGLTKIFWSVALTLSGLLLSSCHQAPSATAKAPATNQLQTMQPPVALATNQVVSVWHVLGSLALTNHCETRLRLIPGKDCLVTPKILDGHNVQITLTVETRNNAGKIIDLTMAQVSTRDGQPLEVAVGGYKLALTPVVARE